MPSNIKKDTTHFVGQASGFTVGANRLTNGDFTAWTGTNDVSEVPTGTWTRGNNDTANLHLRQVGAGQFDGGAGTGAVNIWTDDGSDNALVTTAILTAGKIYRITFDAWVNGGSGALRLQNSAADVTYASVSTSGKKTVYLVAADTLLRFREASGVGTTDVTIDNVEIVEWVGDPDAAGGITIAGLANIGGDLSQIMGPEGQVLHHDSVLALSDDGGNLAIASGGIWDTEPKVGTLVKCDFSAALTSIDDGVFEIITASASSITIDGDSTGFAGKTVEVWIGGAYPDIATAINDSTLSQDPDAIYRKRYICVNVDQEVDAVTIFVAETSETTLREHDGSRKIIGFYDSISVVQPAGSGGDDGYRVVSDMDRGQPYYAGAWTAFEIANSFTVHRPNGKWIEWNGKGNAINILELKTSNYEMRNIKLHNTVTGASEGLIHISTALFNVNFINCNFDTASRWIVDDLIAMHNSVFDCYLGDGLENVDGIDFQNTVFVNCIIDATSRSTGINNITLGSMVSCLFYEGATGIKLLSRTDVSNCILWGQTVDCIRINAGNAVLFASYNNIFMPAAAADIGINVPSAGSIGSTVFNNIFWTVAGVPMTNPIVHGAITPNPPLPVGTIEKDPLFVNPADGDFTLRASSPAVNDGMKSLFDGDSTIGSWGPKVITPNSIYGGWGRGLF